MAGPDDTVDGIEEGGGLDWTVLWDDIQQQYVPPTPAQTPVAIHRPAEGGFDWTELWEDISPPTSKLPSQLAQTESWIPPTPESLPSTHGAHPSTPRSSSVIRPPFTTPSLSHCLSSPASSILQTPTSGHRNIEEEPELLVKRGSDDDRERETRGNDDDNPFIVQQVPPKQMSAPIWKPLIFELPCSWSAKDTPTPVRYHPDTYEVPRQPDFSVTPVHNGHHVGDNSVITWITHHSTSGGLIPSFERLRAIIPSPLYPPIRGVSMFINHPKKRVKIDVEENSPAGFVNQLEFFGEHGKRTSVVHGVHTVNLLSKDPVIRERSKESVKTEMRQTRSLGIKSLIIHLGSEGNLDASHRHHRRTQLIADLQDIITSVPDVTLALENTVHPSPRSLTTLSALVDILCHFPPSRLGICLDLSHIHVCEFDLNDEAGRDMMWNLLKKVGKRRLTCVHVSDNSVVHGGRGDRHANIGSGHINLSTFRHILSHPFLQGVPHLLETPPYFKNFRPSPALWSQRIFSIETQRAHLERSLLQAIVSLDDNQWAVWEGKLWLEYKKLKRQAESKIYKIVLKRGGGVKRKFKKARQKCVGCCRSVEGAKRRNKSKLMGSEDKTEVKAELVKMEKTVES